MMDKIDFMNGQIRGLLNFATAVIQSHPTPALLRHNFETIARGNPNSPEGLSISEAFVHGIADVDQQLAVVLEHAIAKRDREQA